MQCLMIIRPRKSRSISLQVYLKQYTIIIPYLILCSLTCPLAKKNSLEFQLYLNLNYTWDSHRQNDVFQLAHSSTRKTHKKNPMKRVIMAKRLPKMAPNIGMLHRNPRQKAGKNLWAYLSCHFHIRWAPSVPIPLDSHNWKTKRSVRF